MELTNAFIILYFWSGFKVKMQANPVGIYLLKVNNRNTKTRCETCSKLTIKKSERRQRRRSVVFIINFEHIFHLVPGFL